MSRRKLQRLLWAVLLKLSSDLCKAVQDFHQDLTCCAHISLAPNNACGLGWSLRNTLCSFLQLGKIIAPLSQIITLSCVSKVARWAFLCVNAGQESLSNAKCRQMCAQKTGYLGDTASECWLSGSSQKTYTKTLKSCAWQFLRTKARIPEICMLFLWIQRVLFS